MLITDFWRALLKMCMFIVGRNERYGSLSLCQSLGCCTLVKLGCNAAILNSWCDASQIADHVLQGYTKQPLRCKGWEMALLEYKIAMLTDSASKSKPPLTRRLAEISCLCN
ncbi:hypothetical protein IHE45_13G090000 [Dioscorea alata]|uniref:Uncharacterized protein n=2 Tax=Dioscorea alata TaxID=55571 RepID=A0ACB7UZV9_DIOAL|nr:hypothetical protein IHE45_13G090000 [Dioscorea alata]KAH7666263.1 hypothetical protein IHE45_13G090000 [Dioscorea alata]